MRVCVISVSLYMGVLFASGPSAPTQAPADQPVAGLEKANLTPKEVKHLEYKDEDGASVTVNASYGTNFYDAGMEKYKTGDGASADVRTSTFVYSSEGKESDYKSKYQEFLKGRPTPDKESQKSMKE